MAARRFGALFEKWKILRGDKARSSARRQRCVRAGGRAPRPRARHGGHARAQPRARCERACLAPRSLAR
jgi:hypothetical protein